MTTVTYQELQTSNLITFSFESIATNFKTIDTFMKNFAVFQRKFNDMQKIQKANSLDLSNFKMSTTNTFSTLNEVLESRGNISKGNTKGLEEDLIEAKKLIKELKLFVTESTRDLNTTLETKEKETQEVYSKYDAKFAELFTFRQGDRLRIQSLEEEIFSIKAKYTPKLQNQRLKESLKEASSQIENVKEEITEMNTLLQNLGVKQFKQHLDNIEKELNTDMQDMKVKLKLKTDVSDTLKLQEMLLNIITFSYDHLNKKAANKNETKKALIFLQKKINSLLQTLFAEEEGERDGLVGVKGWKCISCTKDLGEFQGKLDKYKAWSVFPAKQHSAKDKYSGFGTGFQNIVETVVTKKGGQISYDEKGRMTAPFNLTREVQAQTATLKHNPSQGKLQKNPSPVKQQPTESNYMNLFGRNSEVDIDIRGEYMQHQKGLMSTLKPSESTKHK